MPKRNVPDNTLRSHDAPASAPSRGPGALSLLVFWPFHLFNLLTRRLSLPVKLLARLIGYPVVAGLYGLVFLGIVYGFRAQHYDLSKIHDRSFSTASARKSAGFTGKNARSSRCGR
jgi:hypothetical protein